MSAGTIPSTEIYPVVVQAMREKGIGISKNKVVDWRIKDPKGKIIEENKED